jgi:pyridoxamine 5'-phosphate oxidase
MDTVNINGINFSLSDIEKDCWHRILNGSLRAKDPMHNPTVANINAGLISIRTVVLQRVDTTNKKIFFHTDNRSGKYNDLLLNPNASWLFYDSNARIQIRLGGTTILHNNNDIADNAWTKTRLNSRKIYIGETPPSTICENPISGIPSQFDDRDPTEAESEIGRKNFTVIGTKVQWMDWLWLNSKGHRRAEFKYDLNNEILIKNWLIP